MTNSTNQGMRIQIANHAVLVAEAIVSSLTEANELWAKYAVVKYKKKLPIGGAIITRADIPRYWNVPVGANIP